jgi:hypothetical protein
MLRVHESYPALYSGLMQRFPFFLCALFMCSVVLQAQESGPDFETVYQTVTIDHDEYQAIITKPKSRGHYPAVLLIAGLGCYSLDHLKPEDPYAHLLNGLTHRGFVTMRVEKNGEGHSQGLPCDSPPSDLQSAVRGWKRSRNTSMVNSMKSS